jgi:leucyl-tRNA synthetase
MCSEVFNNKKTIAYESWPTYDESKLIEDTYEMVVQVNGVLRGKIQVPVSYTDQEMKDAAKKIENVKMKIEGKNIVKEIVVPRKLVNIVVK